MSFLSVRGLRKTYFSHVSGQSVRALNGVDLAVDRGEIFGILGPNGAGKTTLLNCLALLLKPDEGEIELFGSHVSVDSHGLRRRINMTSGNSNFPWCMTVRELLRFYGMLYGIWGRALRKRVAELIELLNLGPFSDRRFDELSTGTKQRLALAKALLNEPEVLFLDEPTIGLDPDVSLRLREFIRDLNRRTQMTVLLTTHYMGEAEFLSHRIAFLLGGSVRALGTPAELKSQAAAQNLEEVFLQLSREGEL